jgi:hypothetical protein
MQDPHQAAPLSHELGRTRVHLVDLGNTTGGQGKSSTDTVIFGYDALFTGHFSGGTRLPGFF